MPASDAMVAALQSGICDLIISVPPKDTARLAKEFNMVRGTPGALTYEVRVNGAKPPFDKKEARQALHYAIDRQGIVNNVLFGVSEPTVLPFSRNSPAYDRSTQGANGTVAIGLGGDVTYTPNADFNGTDSYTYTVKIGRASCRERVL